MHFQAIISGLSGTRSEWIEGSSFVKIDDSDIAFTSITESSNRAEQLWPEAKVSKLETRRVQVSYQRLELIRRST